MKTLKRLLLLLAASAVFFSCQYEEVDVPVYLKSIVLNPTQATLVVGDQLFIASTIGPLDANNKSLIWSSSDESVAKVDAGLVTATGAGEAVIKAEAADGNGANASCRITVRLFPATLSFDPGESLDLVFGSEGGSSALSFKAAESWTVSAINTRADSWLSFTPESGGPGECSITVSAAPSGEVDDRSASLQIVCGEDSALIKVTQKQKDALTVTSSLFEVDALGGSVSVTVKSNVEFEFSVEEAAASWVQYVDTKSFDTHTLLFSVLPNDAVTGREARVTIAASDISEAVKIYQYGSQPAIVVSGNEFEVGSGGGEIKIDVRSNVDVSMHLPDDVPWIHEGDVQSTNTFVVSVDPNPEPDGRCAVVSFTGGGLEQTVTITQRQLDIIELLNADVIVPEEGGSFEVELDSNVEYEVSVDGDWVSEVSTRGITRSRRSFIADPLPLTSAIRSATLFFSSPDGSVSKTFSVAQKEESPWIEFADPEAENACLRYWDFNSDGHLSEREAAAVTDLGDAFTWRNTITSFDELRFFTSLEAIPDNAFKGCQSLRSITLPAQIQSIGSGAFMYCSSLSSLTVHSGVKTIGESAFEGCSSLSYIEFLSTVPPQAGRGFLSGTGTGWIFVPDESVEAYKAEESWSGVSDRITGRDAVEASPLIEFADSEVKRICIENWDRDRDGELSELEASLVTELGRTFYNNKTIVSFDELRFFTSLTALTPWEFGYCESLRSISVPSAVSNVSDYVFYFCKSLTDVSLPESLRTIRSYTFSNCTALEHIDLPEGLQSIGERAFLNCSALKEITVPSTVVSVGTFAFYGCTSISYIEFLSGEPPVAGDSFLKETSSCWVFVPQSGVQAYREADVWNGYSDRIITRQEVEESARIEFKDPEVKRICIENWDRDRDGELSELEASLVKSLRSRFRYKETISSFDELRFFTSLDAIESWAFGGCSSLRSITLPAQIQSIGSSAFNGCTSLEHLVVPESVRDIGSYAFIDCNGLKDIEFLSAEPPGAGEYFLWNTGKGWIYVPDNKEADYQSASAWEDYSDRIACRRTAENSELILFNDDEAKQICVNEWDRNFDGELSRYEAFRVKTLNGRFSRNENLVFLDVLQFFTGLEILSGYDFYGCKSLRGISFPDHLSELPNGVLDDCSSLESVHLPQSLESIGAWAFGSCDKLEQISVPEGVKNIGAYAFYNCSALQDIEFQSPFPPAAGKYFMYMTGSCYIYVPEASVQDYKAAEYWNVHSVRITCRGHEPYEFYYKSADYSMDGEVVQLQKASVGRGLDIVFLGEGYTDRDLSAGGAFEEAARAYMEQMFVYEPYKTLRDRFNVWCVKAVSENSEFGSPYSHRKFSTDGEDGSLSVNNSLIRSYARNVTTADGNPRKIAVLHNTLTSLGRSYCYVTAECLAMIFDPVQTRPTVLNHELGGHGIGFLADEYTEFEGYFPNPSSLDNEYDKYGLWGNVDWRSDPSTVRWAHLLSDPRYSSEGLGVFEGAQQYTKGIFRSTENSMMGADYAKGAVFNAISREMIYRQVMKYSEGPEWSFDYEEFVKADEAGRRQAADAYAGLDILNSPRRMVTREEDIRPERGLPPIRSDRFVGTVTVYPDGRVVLGY